MSNHKIVLAFSGGLDTTFCAVFLNQVKGYAVHAVTINTGAFSPNEVLELEAKAKRLGAESFQCIDVREDYYRDCIRFLIFGNVLKNGTYPLSVSAERVIQAMKIAAYAKSHGIHRIAHGSTGAGNDQVRFDMIIRQVMPEAEIITPIRDERMSREAEIAFLKARGVEGQFAKAPYSINKGLWGTSVGGLETLTSNQSLPEEAWPTPLTSLDPVKITLDFVEGEVVSLNGQSYTHPVQVIEDLQRLAQPFGIGRDVHVGDTIIGIKGRVGFEAAAPLILIKAHHLLEKHVLTKWQLYWKDQISAWYGNWLHEGQMMDPVMRDMEAFMLSTQKNMTGRVMVTLYPHRFELEGIESKHDLMSSRFGTYGEMNLGWTAQDAKGFTRIFGNQTGIYHQVNAAITHEKD